MVHHVIVASANLYYTKTWILWFSYPEVPSSLSETKSESHRISSTKKSSHWYSDWWLWSAKKVICNKKFVKANSSASLLTPYFYAKVKKHLSTVKLPTNCGTMFLLIRAQIYTWSEICWIKKKIHKIVTNLFLKDKVPASLLVNIIFCWLSIQWIFFPVSVPPVPQSVDDKLGALPSSPDDRLGWMDHGWMLFGR